MYHEAVGATKTPRLQEHLPPLAVLYSFVFGILQEPSFIELDLFLN
jgi:hypothetical protein